MFRPYWIGCHAVLANTMPGTKRLNIAMGNTLVRLWQVAAPDVPKYILVRNVSVFLVVLSHIQRSQLIEEPGRSGSDYQGTTVAHPVTGYQLNSVTGHRN